MGTHTAHETHTHHTVNKLLPSLAVGHKKNSFLA